MARSALRLCLALWAVGFFVLAAAPATVQGQAELSQKEIDKLIVSYVGDSDAESRARTLTQLKQVKSALMQKKLKAMIGDEKVRPGSIELATACRVSGLFEAARKFAEGDNLVLVVRLALGTLDKGAPEWAVGRWKSLEPESPAFEAVHGAFLECNLPAAVLALFKDFIADKASAAARVDKAAEILMAQMALPPFEDVQDWVRKWEALAAEYTQESQAFELKGFDLLDTDPVRVRGEVVKIARNRRIAPNAELQWTVPAGWRKGNFTVNLRVRVISGGEAAIWIDKAGDLSCTSLFLTASYDWTTKMDTKAGQDAAKKIRATLKKWQTISMVITDHGNSRHSCEVKIENESLVTGAAVPGEIKSLSLNSEKTRLQLGGLELVRRK
ncbi:MAG: hypothetical protein IT462_03790 [Planctomycetes bacterium]|nr:hypothetical protein [Planctomycetota bacterium]